MRWSAILLALAPLFAACSGAGPSAVNCTPTSCPAGYACGVDRRCYPVAPGGDLTRGASDGGAADLASPVDLAPASDLAIPADLAPSCGPCAAPTPVCDPDTRQCVPCLPGRDLCADGTYCEKTMAGYQCSAGCKGDRDCAGQGKSPACCDHACVDTAASKDHCGRCGMGCGNLSCCLATCVDVKKELAHCGACGRSCAGGQANWSCTGGNCAVTACNAGFADCNLDGGDGCEADTRTSLDHCGGCGKPCKAANAQTACANGRCALQKCDPGFADCNQDSADGCEVNLTNSVQNCGQCGKLCAPLPNAAAGCKGGACAIGACLAGFDDCDGNAANGCEVAVGSDVKNCGQCGKACAPLPNGMVLCMNGVCAGACGNQFKDCNGNMADGCETDTASDPLHCGACGKKCALPNTATHACANGACAVQACSPGFGDCDGNGANGCEADLNRDPNHCTACGKACPMGQSCVNGNCQMGIFPFPSYNAVKTFKDALASTTMTLTWDGTSYWSASGGSNSGVRYARYDANFKVLGTYQPGIDFRSVYTAGGKGPTVFARGYSSMQIRVQTSPGVFGNSVLLAGNIDAQAQVVMNENGSEMVALSGGTIYRWNAATGASLGTIRLVNFGTLNNENGGIQNRGVARAGGHYLTYSQGVLSAWDGNGNRVKTTILTGAGTGSDSYYSFGYAGGLVWIVDGAGGTWRGYDVGL